MAQKPDGKAAGVERATFTKSSAERIAKAVRTVEAGNRDTPGIGFGVRLQALASRPIRICTFTGSWSVDAFKTVTFRNQTTTPNTVSAINLFLALPDYGTATRNCAVAKDGTAWHLIQWQWDASTALHSVTLGTASLEFTRINVGSLGTASTVGISITTCSTASS